MENSLYLHKTKPKKLSLLWFLNNHIKSTNMTSKANVQEIFKDIPNFEGIYQISNLGSVKSLERKVKHSKGGLRMVKEKILKPTDDGKGYLQVMLQRQGRIKLFQVHQLVAMVFLNHKPCGHKLVVDHINNISSDNRVENLQLISNRENSSKDKKGGSSKYVGVCWSKAIRKWIAYIKINEKRIHLGTFKDEYKAHLAYQNKLKEILNGK